MKIACVDKTAADRVKLQRRFDDAYEQCRNAIGHVTLALTYPASKDEVLINAAPDAIAIGPGFPLEEAYTTCRDIKHAFPHVPVFLFLSRDVYSLRALKRFEKVANEIFAEDETAVRIVHKLSTLDTHHAAKNGKLIVVSGAKGGVGVTSLVAGLAHAAEALGKQAIVMDLSPMSAMAQYMAADRWHSPDYSSLLVDMFNPDQAAAERVVTCAPNGVHLVVPPSGGTDVREMWLRDPKRFEITLSIIEILKDLYDIVIVDTARAEGVLNFALNSRANARLLVTSNDPASVHLLSSVLSSIAEIPGEGQIQILINSLHERGLKKEDVLDFLSINEHFKDTMAMLEPIPFDHQGRSWIGTGNTFYTECTSSVQQLLEETLQTLMLSEKELENREIASHSLFSGIKRLANKVQLRKRLELTRKNDGDPISNDEEATSGSKNNVIFAPFSTFSAFVGRRRTPAPTENSILKPPPAALPEPEQHSAAPQSSPSLRVTGGERTPVREVVYTPPQSATNGAMLYQSPTRVSREGNG